MIEAGARRRLMVPTLVALAAFGILIALGTWQIERRAWKHELIAAIAARMAADPAPLPAELDDPAEWEFRRVSVAGRFLNDKERHLYHVGPKGGAGYHVFAPLARDDGGAIMVNRGWVPEENKDPATRAAGQIEGPTVVTGMLRLRETPPRWMASRPGYRERNIYYLAQPQYLGSHVGIEVPDYYVAVDAGANPAGGPQGGLGRPELPDNHLQYALTWYGLAVALAGVYGLAVRRRLRGEM